MTLTAARRAVVVETYADYAVEAYNLRKVYRTRKGRQAAVDGLDLRVPLGGVHGFLGPNGSGKTTTIRMLLGLVAADSGYIRVFDHEVPLHLDRVIDRVGAIVEQPKFFPSFSGRKNLTLLATAIGSPRRRVDQVLADVGLADRAGDKFRTYSLGMKQRLAIAATLLKDPSLLIFDEPTNGLDPAGIHEIRATMRGLADRGKTVLVSSHILSEVQQVADTVSIIGRGRMLAEGRVSDILDAAGEQYARVMPRRTGPGGRPAAGGGFRGRAVRAGAARRREPRPARPGRDHPGAGRAGPLRPRAGHRSGATWSRSSWSSPPISTSGRRPARPSRPPADRAPGLGGLVTAAVVAETDRRTLPVPRRGRGWCSWSAPRPTGC